MTAPLLLVVLILAAFRITRFVVDDSLIAGTRERVLGWCFRRKPNGVKGLAGTIQTDPPPLYRSKLGDLLTCAWCTGIWCSLAVTCIGLRHWPWTLGVNGWLFALAVAGGQGLASHFTAAS